MRYRYCPGCGQVVSYERYVADSRVLSNCPECNYIVDIGPTPSKIHFIGSKVEHPEYSPAFGCVIKNKSHRNEMAKQKGMEEIGNEPVEKIHKHFDTMREEKRERSWEEV